MAHVFQAGGTLVSGKLYVERPADGEIERALRASEFCHVLAPRQIGKTSLCIRAMQRLRENGVRCAWIDVTAMGTQTAKPEHWYYTFAVHLVEDLQLELDLGAFWQRHGKETTMERLTRLIRDEVTPTETRPVVIIVDEIDVLLSRPELGDEFFGAVRAFANARATTPAYEHLAFCLVGVCAPTDLVHDKLVTPYNIASRAIRLEDFTRAELDAFRESLGSSNGDPRELLDAIFRHTEGHPYMTQALLVGLCAGERRFTSVPPSSGATTPLPEAPQPTGVERIDALVVEKFLNPPGTGDRNLKYAEARFKEYQTETDGAAILGLYRSLIEGDRIAARSDDSRQTALRLAGMAAERRDAGGAVVLRVRNPIFADVFNRAWVKEQEAKRLVTEPLARWKESDHRDDLLLDREALERAFAWARGRDDLTPEECNFLLLSVVRAGKKQSELELERSLRVRAELETQTEARKRSELELEQSLRVTEARVGHKWQWRMFAIGTAALVSTGVMLAVKVRDDAEIRRVSTSMDADRAALQETLNRQKEEFDGAKALLYEKVKVAENDVALRKRDVEDAKQRAAALEQKAKDAEEAQSRTARMARRDADDAKRTAEEAKGLLQTALQAERDMNDRYDEAKKQAADAERRAGEAVASERRTKELAEAAMQTEHEARVKAEGDLNSERIRSDAERKRLKGIAEANRKACEKAEERLEDALAECEAHSYTIRP